MRLTPYKTPYTIDLRISKSDEHSLRQAGMKYYIDDDNGRDGRSLPDSTEADSLQARRTRYKPDGIRYNFAGTAV
ncbi:MAG: hypothetical protein MZV63_49975 [Marinilabiliales bacterium]|nr:hypothetical protein [Marinilabiliales bacterium]